MDHCIEEKAKLRPPPTEVYKALTECASSYEHQLIYRPPFFPEVLFYTQFAYTIRIHNSHTQFAYTIRIHNSHTQFAYQREPESDYEMQEDRPVPSGSGDGLPTTQQDVEKFLKKEDYYGYKVLKSALTGYYGIDEYGAMWFETKDINNKTVVCRDERYAIYPMLHNNRDPTKMPKDLSASRMLQTNEVCWINVYIKYYWRVPRNILWKEINEQEEEVSIRNCLIGARPELREHLDCCINMKDELEIFQRDWMNGFIATKISQCAEFQNMRRVRNIVCFQLGRLTDVLGKIDPAALFRHLTAYAIQQALMRHQPAEARREPIQIIAADHEYNKCCKKFLNSIKDRDPNCAQGTPGFTFLERELECFKLHYLTKDTVFVSLKPRDMCLLPALGLSYDSKKGEKRHGPAAFGCPEIVCDGTDAPTPKSIASREARQDSSPVLWRWKEAAKDGNGVLSLDDTEHEPNKALRGLTFDKNGGKSVPMIYFRRPLPGSKW
jgi:hypothetical protein